MSLPDKVSQAWQIASGIFLDQFKSGAAFNVGYFRDWKYQLGIADYVLGALTLGLTLGIRMAYLKLYQDIHDDDDDDKNNSIIGKKLLFYAVLWPIDKLISILKFVLTAIPFAFFLIGFVPYQAIKHERKYSEELTNNKSDQFKNDIIKELQHIASQINAIQKTTNPNNIYNYKDLSNSTLSLRTVKTTNNNRYTSFSLYITLSDGTEHELVNTVENNKISRKNYEVLISACKVVYDFDISNINDWEEISKLLLPENKNDDSTLVTVTPIM
jgi:hypothetical protein